MSPQTLRLTGLVAAVLVLGVASYAYRRVEPEGANAIADSTRGATRRDSNVAPVTAEPPPPKPAASARPHLIRAIPNSAVLTMGAAIEVELRGTGFTPTENSILFGTLNGGTVASVNGSSIRFMVPTEYPARGEVAPMAVQPGAYPIVVRNKNGTSDTLMFTLRSGAP